VPAAVTEKLAVWPAVTVWFAGCAVIEGATAAALTVSVAAPLVTLPAELLTNYRKLRPVIGTCRSRRSIAGRGRTADGAAVLTPLIGQRSCARSSHREASRLAAVTVWFAGCAVIEGATAAALTVSVAAPLVTLPAELLTTTENCAPLSELAVAGEV